MRTKRHWVLYGVSFGWDSFGWLGVLLIWLLWGKGLRWERRPGLDDAVRPYPGGWCLACDLKPDSWPTRSWYRHKSFNPKTGEKEPAENPKSMWERYGRWRTGGGTTISPHAIFYGPGRIDLSEWSPLRFHEHEHSEQGEAAMLRGLAVAIVVAVVLLALGHPQAALWTGLALWITGYWRMGASHVTAWLRGEDPYRGSHIEEAAYDAAKLYEQEQKTRR